MDRKSVIVLVASFAIIVALFKFTDRVFPRKEVPITNVVSTATNEITAETNASISTVVSTNRTVALTQTNAPEQLLTVTNENAVYIFTSRGGGLKTVALKDYRETIECGRNVPGERRFATLNTKAPTAAFTLLGDGFSEALNYDLKQTEQGVRAETRLPNGLVVTKDFQIGTNYLFHTKVRIENSAGGSVALPSHQLVIGTATPMSVHDQGITMGVFWYNGNKEEHVAESWFANKTLGCFPGTPRPEYIAGSSNVVWAAVHNQFFTMVAIPQKPAPQMVSRKISLPPPSAEELAGESKAVREPFGFQTGFLYPATTLASNQAIEHDFTTYAGPKEYKALSKLGAQMKNDVDAVMGFRGFFGWFAQMLLLALNWLHSWGLHYGVAIIVLTIFIKGAFWPLTNASTKSMKRMQALQPQIKAIQEKYKDDPKKMNMKVMEFMREHKVSPIGGCLPMLLQIPVFFGFYRMLQSAIELRGVSFLWACDLSQADTVAHIAGFPINPLPIIMGFTMLWQARITPQAPGADPAQQKMMKYMPLMFLFILYNMQAGLTLYWTVQNLLTIVQTKLTKASEDPAAPTAPARSKSKK